MKKKIMHNHIFQGERRSGVISRCRNTGRPPLGVRFRYLFAETDLDFDLFFYLSLPSIMALLVGVLFSFSIRS